MSYSAADLVTDLFVALEKDCGFVLPPALHDDEDLAEAGAEALRFIREKCKAKKRQQPYCTTCGGTDVRSDAYAAWNVERQEWELVTTFDNTDCETCGGECTIEWKDVPVEAAL
jgi:hypothetical protein